MMIIVDVTWTAWSEWSEWTHLCDTSTRYKDRQCLGSVPVFTEPSRHFHSSPQKTFQYGGQRDCEGKSRDELQFRSQPYSGRMFHHLLE